VLIVRKGCWGYISEVWHPIGKPTRLLGRYITSTTVPSKLVKEDGEVWLSLLGRGVYQAWGLWKYEALNEQLFSYPFTWILFSNLTCNFSSSSREGTGIRSSRVGTGMSSSQTTTAAQPGRIISLDCRYQILSSDHCTKPPSLPRFNNNHQAAAWKPQSRHHRLPLPILERTSRKSRSWTRLLKTPPPACLQREVLWAYTRVS